MQKDDTTVAKQEKSKSNKEKDRTEWTISLIGAQLTIFHATDSATSHYPMSSLVSSNLPHSGSSSSSQQAQQQQHRAHCFRLATERVKTAGKEKADKSSSNSREKFMFSVSTDEEKRMWVAALEHCKIGEVLLAALNADHTEYAGEASSRIDILLSLSLSLV
jgi:hypothetical protein